MCKLTKNLPIRIQGGDFGKGRGIQGGRELRPPSELCFETSEIELSYIMYTFLTLL